MSACDFLPRLDAYYDGAVRIEEQRQIEAHLDTCAQCRQELASLEALSKRLAMAQGPELSAPMIGRLRESIDAQSSRGLLRTARTLLALAACLLLACTIWAWSAGSSAAEPAPAWETAAVNPQPDTAASTNPQVAMATWIVQDLGSGERDAK
jgi:anti-sigma factor RsiW